MALLTAVIVLAGATRATAAVYEPNDSASSAVDLNLYGGSIQAFLETPQDVDWYSVTLSPYASTEVQGVADSCSSVTFQVFDAQMNLQSKATADDHSSLDAPITSGSAPTKYYVEVTGDGTTAPQCSYWLIVGAVNPPALNPESLPGTPWLAPAAKTQATPQTVLDDLNAQRATLGIGPLRFSAFEATACTQHDRYLAHNDDTGPAGAHSEDPESPWASGMYYAQFAGYFDGQSVGTSGEVLAFSGAWSLTDNPWGDPAGTEELNAPDHELNMFNPNWTIAGGSSAYGNSCFEFSSDGNQPIAAQTQPGYYSLPADGATNVSPSYEEDDIGPQVEVGLPASALTGHQILAWPAYQTTNTCADPPCGTTVDRKTTSVTGQLLTAAGAAVPTHFWSGDDMGVDLIPLKPLAPGTAYQAVFSWHEANPDGSDPRIDTQTVHFTTAANPDTAATPARPTRQQIARALVPSLAVAGRSSRIPAILRTGGYVTGFRAPTTGKILIDWYALVHHRKALIATAMRNFGKSSADNAKLKVRLTRAGRRLLKTSRSLRVVITASFLADWGATTRSRTATLHR